MCGEDVEVVFGVLFEVVRCCWWCFVRIECIDGEFVNELLFWEFFECLGFVFDYCGLSWVFWFWFLYFVGFCFVFEGDMIYKVVECLSFVFECECLCCVELYGCDVLSLWCSVESVCVVGKYLLFEFDSGEMIWVYLGMYGLWYCYVYGECWCRLKR